MNKAFNLFFLLLLVAAGSCKRQTSNTVTVYNNDFESQDLTGIAGGIIGTYNGSTVLGQYNNGNFTLTLNNLPNHNLISVSFDLYIHDSWDGNNGAPDGPDIWKMLVDDKVLINTTFSNIPCVKGYFCAPQSYPFNYPNNYNSPKTGAANADLPGVCHVNGTALYKITKTFAHSSSSFSLQCADNLVQTNTATPKCDESWSVDNITIQAIAK